MVSVLRVASTSCPTRLSQCWSTDTSPQGCRSVATRCELARRRGGAFPAKGTADGGAVTTERCQLPRSPLRPTLCTTARKSTYVLLLREIDERRVVSRRRGRLGSLQPSAVSGEAIAVSRAEFCPPSSHPIPLVR